MSTAQTEVAAITTIDPDLQISATSVFRDDTWNFDVTLPGKQQNRIYWAVELGDGSLLTDPKNRKWLDAAKTFLYRYMQGEVSLDRELRTGTVINKAFNLRKLIWWMSERNLFSFSSLTEQHIISYRNSIRVRRARKRGQGGVTVIGEKNLSRAGKRQALVLVKHLIALQHAIPDGPNCDRQAVYDALERDTSGSSRQEPGRTARIPDNTFCELMDTALYWIRQIGPPLLERDAEFIAYQSSHNWTTYGKYDGLASADRANDVVRVAGASYNISALTRSRELAWLNHLGAACVIVIAGLTGIRVSELLSLKQNCLSVVPVDRDRRLLRVTGTVYKTSRKKHGDPAQWVAGWDEAQNPVRQAVETLKALHTRRGEVDADLPLLSPIAEKQCGRRSARPEFSAQSVAARVNRFAAFNGITGWRFAAHQFRKTFARLVTVVAPNAALALQRHYKHVSLQMTERYIAMDAELIDDIIEESLVLQEERLLAIVTSDRLGGIKGEEIMSRNEQYRGAGARESAMELVKLTMLDPSVHIVLHVYGACFYEESKAKCAGAIANVGLKTCHGCSNFAVDPSHLPFWQQQLAAIENSIAEVRGLGMMSSALEQQRKDASEMVERLSGHGRP